MTLKQQRALGKSKVATDLNHALDKIVASIHTSYEELIERKGSATPKDATIAFQGMASRQESLLSYCEKFHKMILQRVGINLKVKSYDQYRIAFKT